MRHVLPLFLVSFALGQDAPLTQGALTQGERDRAMSYLHATQKQVTDTIHSLTPAQLAYHAGPGRWSVADCLEHLALTESGLFAMITQQVMKSPPAPDLAEVTKGKDDQVMKMIASRDVKAKAPEMFVPSNKWKTTAETLAAFRAARKTTIAYVESTPDALRTHYVRQPMPMDGYQVVLMIGAHTERHLAQMKEVIASTGFPKP
ncbi:MAG: DinB family protein [Bryobacteraceae bacterium]|nr:DinB family protein [Bryobacteraceae bacterium]